MAAERSNAPVYSVLSTYMGEGIVGGRLLDVPRAGDEAGKLAVRILRGNRRMPSPSLGRTTILICSTGANSDVGA